MLLIGCSGASPAAEAPTAAARTSSAHGPAIAPAASQAAVRTGSAAEPAVASPPPQEATAAPVDALATRRFRIVSARSGRTLLELGPNGSVTGARRPPAKLEADGRLVVSGRERAFRLSASGELLDGATVFGRFVDERTLSCDPGITLRVADDGRVTATDESATPPQPLKMLSGDFVRIEADDGPTRKLALFVLASENRAANPLIGLGDLIGESKIATAVAIGVGAAALGALVAVRLYGDAKEYKQRLRPLQAKVKKERAAPLDRLCASKGAHPRGYRYTGGSSAERAEFGRLEMCEPLPGTYGNAQFCCRW